MYITVTLKQLYMSANIIIIFKFLHEKCLIWPSS